MNRTGIRPGTGLGPRQPGTGPRKIEVLTDAVIEMQRERRPANQDETVQFRQGRQRLPKALGGFSEHVEILQPD